MRFPNGPENDGGEQCDIDHQTSVEWTVECVDKEQLKPASHLHDSGHDAVEDRCHQQEADAESNEATLKRGLSCLLVVEDEHQSRQTQKVEQVHADGEAGEIGNEDEISVRAGLVGMVFPFEHHPKHDCREERGVGIDFTLNGREPEGVGEAVDECTGESGSLYGDALR